MPLQIEQSVDISPDGEVVVTYDSTRQPFTITIRLTNSSNSCTVDNLDAVALGDLVSKLRRVFLMAAKEEGLMDIDDTDTDDELTDDI